MKPIPATLWLALLLCLSLSLGPAGATAAVPRQLHYEGTIDYEGHYPRPGDTRRYLCEQRYTTDGAGSVRLEWTTWKEGDSTRVPESFLIVGDRVFHRDDPASRWKLRAGERARLARFQAMAGLRGEDLIEPHAHPRLGDVRDSVIFTPGRDAKDPTTMLEVLHERDGQWRMIQRLVEAGASLAADSLFAAPAAFDPPDPSDDSLSAEPVIVELAPGVFAAEMEAIDSRSLIVEFSDHLAVAELAVGSENGERIVEAARRRWPNKPIRYALFSHHHPHYTGGIRALIAEGATFVTTPGNEAMIRERATLPFTIRPDRLARSPKPVSIRTFADRTELADAANQLIAINYGKRSEHTDEFVVFYLPRAKLLFESELGWFRMDDGTLRGSRRAKTLLEWLASEKLDVERLAQGWPMRGNERELSRARLAELVAPAKH